MLLLNIPKVLLCFSSYLLLCSHCFQMTPQLMEAALSGFVNDVWQRTVRPDVRLVVSFSLRHEIIR